MLEAYLRQITEITQRGDATESSYYSALESLLREFAKRLGREDVLVTILPKKTEAGYPDFKVSDGEVRSVGCIEAKAPSVEHLDAIEQSDQLKRYRETFPNLILTNFFEFRLYRDGALIKKVLLARAAVMFKLGAVPPVERKKEFFDLLEQFFSFSIPRIRTAEALTKALAKKTKFLRDEIIKQELQHATAFTPDSVYGFYEAFKHFLIADLKPEDFADLYSQTITYGLFAARMRAQNGFNRKLAYDNIPATIGILRDLFRFVSLGDLPRPMQGTVDDIAEILAVTDVKSALHHQESLLPDVRPRDPIIHFYETFLAEYDPRGRKQRGVYYTPEPVVSYIVRSLHHVLKRHFKKAEGLASSAVTILDPAAGTGTFLAETARLAIDEHVVQHGDGKKQDFIREHILENFYAFELMMAPYAVAHMKLSFVLEELGYQLQRGDRFKLYLTNTLEMEDLAQTSIPGIASLAEESHAAGRIKKEQPILVILGNPPYFGKSTNKTKFIEKEMALYKQEVRSERNIQPLSDDYIKFLCFAHWKIEQAGRGIIGMITNNSYLSGLIHRGMRQELLKSFNEIYVLNLHGSSRIGERCPDGSKDENVFDIMQGVSIALFVKHKEQSGLGKAYYQEVYGLRKHKSVYLLDHDITTTKWLKLKPTKPYYFLVTKDFSEQAEYQRFWSVQDVFVMSSCGIKTHRDDLVVGFSKEEVAQKISLFAGRLTNEEIRRTFDLKDTVAFNLEKVRQTLRTINWKESIRPYSYRPFDKRYLCYQSELIDRDRRDMMKHFLRNNCGLVTMRQYLYDRVDIYNYVFCTMNIIDDRHFISNRGACTIFPLYIYKEKKRKKHASGTFMLLFEPQADYGQRQPNLNPKLVEILTQVYDRKPTPEQIFFYIYAVLYSNVYRTKYAEFLKIDFPRIPFTRDVRLFLAMTEYGEELVNLHVLKTETLPPAVVRFQDPGEGKVETLRYDEKTRRVYINANQYFDGVRPEVWEYQVGGYQVCHKWLKDRKGRLLSLEETKVYSQIVTALQKTIALQKEIDKEYPKIEASTIYPDS